MLSLVFIGNLTANPETRFVDTANGQQTVCNFTVAVNRVVRGQKATEYYRVSCWNKQADNAAKYLHKGSKVCITASTISARAYTDRNGEARASLEVPADGIEYLSSKSDDAQQGQMQPQELAAELSPCWRLTLFNPNDLHYYVCYVDARSGEFSYFYYLSEQGEME